MKRKAIASSQEQDRKQRTLTLEQSSPLCWIQCREFADVLCHIIQHFSATTMRKWLLTSKTNRLHTQGIIHRETTNERYRSIALNLAQNLTNIQSILTDDVVIASLLMCLRSWPRLMMKAARYLYSPLKYSNYDSFRDFINVVGVEEAKPYITKKWTRKLHTSCLTHTNCKCPCSLFPMMAYEVTCPPAPRKIRRIL